LIIYHRTLHSTAQHTPHTSSIRALSEALTVSGRAGPGAEEVGVSDSKPPLTLGYGVAATSHFLCCHTTRPAASHTASHHPCPTAPSPYFVPR